MQRSNSEKRSLYDDSLITDADSFPENESLRLALPPAFDVNEVDDFLMPRSIGLTKAFSAENISSFNFRTSPKPSGMSPTLSDTQDFMFMLERLRSHKPEHYPEIKIKSVHPGRNLDYSIELSESGREWGKLLKLSEFQLFYSFVSQQLPSFGMSCGVPPGFLQRTQQGSETIGSDQVHLILFKVLEKPVYERNYKVGLAASMLLDTRYRNLELAYKLASHQGNLASPMFDKPSGAKKPAGEIPLSVYPSPGSEAERNRVYTIMYIILKNGISRRCFKVGSALTKTYLPQEPMKFSICINQSKRQKPWYAELLGILCQMSLLSPKEAANFALGDSANGALVDVGSVSFSETTETVCLTLNGFLVEVSSNRIEHLYAGCMIEAADQALGINHLFKKAIICLKWLLQTDMEGEFNDDLDFVIAGVLVGCIKRKRSENLDMFSLLVGAVQSMSQENSTYMHSACEEFAFSNSLRNPTLSQFQTVFEEILESIDISGDTNSAIETLSQSSQYSGLARKLRYAASRLMMAQGFQEYLFGSLDRLGNLIDFDRETKLNHLLSVDPTTLNQNIKYFKLILTPHLSLIPLLTLIKEVLFEVGPLPVGEVGKMLQLITNRGSINNEIKEHYGGLKKLFLQHEDEFYMANDHQYNPKVYLSQLLTPQDMQQIEVREPPVQYLGRLFGSDLAKMRPGCPAHLKAVPEIATKKRGEGGSMSSTTFTNDEASSLSSTHHLQAFGGRGSRSMENLTEVGRRMMARTTKSSSHTNLQSPWGRR